MSANWNWLLLVCCVFLLVPLSVACAVEDQPAVSQPAASATEIDRWIEQLDADQFAERQEASRKLAEVGPAAIDALSRAAIGESLEVTVRRSSS